MKKTTLFVSFSLLSGIVFAQPGTKPVAKKPTTKPITKPIPPVLKNLNDSASNTN